ncbi:MAG: hypothetical protein WAK17_03930 [Candidatus Nitrosopolaris sp.]
MSNLLFHKPPGAPLAPVPSLLLDPHPPPSPPGHGYDKLIRGTV